MRTLSFGEAYSAACQLLTKLGGSERLRVYGVPRGGRSAAILLALAASNHGTPVHSVVDTPEEANLIIDDLVASGATRARYQGERRLFASLFTKRAKEDAADGLNSFFGAMLPADEYVIFPWEGDAVHSADDIPIRLLEFIGENPKRGGLRETPARFLKAWQEWTAGYGQDPKAVLKEFEDGGEKYDEMIVVSGTPVFSHCEHHMAAIFGCAHVGYIPNGKVVGLSKIPRLIEVFARRLQVQERLTVQIADALQEHLKPKGVGVILQCRHLCLESRGIQKMGTITTTSSLRGRIKEDPQTRAEFLSFTRSGI